MIHLPVTIDLTRKMMWLKKCCTPYALSMAGTPSLCRERGRKSTHFEATREKRESGSVDMNAIHHGLKVDFQPLRKESLANYFGIFRA
jgi:hypothetical protein